MEPGKRVSTFSDFGFNALVRFGVVFPLDAPHQPFCAGWYMFDIDGYRVDYSPDVADFPANVYTVDVGDEDNFVQSLIIRDMRRLRLQPIFESSQTSAARMDCCLIDNHKCFCWTA